LIGLDRMDDAGVFKIRDDLALIQTVDFITPIVDTPFEFGQIAAANALSDVYAMGGVPLTAMNIVAFPIKKLKKEILKEILRGGLEKLNEADVALVGGHSVDDEELKYGLSVTGTVHPGRVIANSGARIADRLILTKPIGTGIIATAIKGKTASKEAEKKVVESMSALNKDASKLMQEIGVHACTDVTGFGLIGHLTEMLRGSEGGFLITASQIPHFKEALHYAAMGLVPAGCYANKNFYQPHVEIKGNHTRDFEDMLYDPQTSGGLIIAVEAKKAELLLENLHTKGIDVASIIGEVIPSPKDKIVVSF
jgi:selenide,water dikinase